MRTEKLLHPPMGFRKFCETVWPDRFTVPFATGEVGAVASVRDLAAASRAVMTGGLHAVILERGKGKTTLACALTIWAVHEGLRNFPVLRCKDPATLRKPFDAMLAQVRRDIDIDPWAAHRPGVRGKVEYPDFYVFDEPIDEADAEAFTAGLATASPGKTISGILFGDIGLCRALHKKGWA